MEKKLENMCCIGIGMKGAVADKKLGEAYSNEMEEHGNDMYSIGKDLA